jgi:cysteinyl-tRNA synthetase
MFPKVLEKIDHPLLEKGYSPMVARFFMLQTHYSSTLDFSNEALQASEKGFQRLMEAMKIMNSFDASTFPKEEKAIDAEVKKSLDAIFTAMNDDFSTPRAIAALFDLSSTINKVKHEALLMSASMWEEMKNTVNTIVVDVLGLIEESGQDSGITDGLMQLVLQMRKDARERKDWAASDKIRDQLAALKIQVKDGKDGASWSFM